MALFVTIVRLGFQFVFGDRSSQSMQASLLTGLQLAAWVLVFGVLNLVCDFQKLLSVRTKYFKTFTTSLSLTLSLTPTVAQTAARLRNASRLRAFRSRFRLVRSVAIPVLSNAIDQAINLADSMEFRTKTPRRQGEISLQNLTFGYHQDKPVFKNLDFTAAAGSLTVIHGRTGCGKSTLLKVIGAKLPGAGYVAQFPRETFVASTVYEELSFSLKHLGKPNDEIAEVVRELLSQFGLHANDKLSELSAGWQQRVAIAAALASGSKILLLDEPFSALDQAGIEVLMATLRTLKASGITVVVVEHRTREILPLADNFFKLENGTLLAQHPGHETLVDRRLHEGSITVILGDNGSGKTTYLNQVSRIRGVLVPQPASDLLFLDSVSAELSQADRDANLEAGSSRKLFERFVSNLDFSQNPRDLSEGQKLALAISIQLAHKSNFLMLDEPTLGFDLQNRQNLGDLLCELAEGGVEILVATHDQEFASAFASKIVPISEAVTSAKF